MTNKFYRAEIVLEPSAIRSAKTMIPKRMNLFLKDIREELIGEFGAKSVIAKSSWYSMSKQINDKLNQYYSPVVCDIARAIFFSLPSGDALLRLKSLEYEYLLKNEYDELVKGDLNNSKLKKVIFSVFESNNKKLKLKQGDALKNLEAPKNAVFGQFAFGEDRGLLEKDTAIEKKVLRALERHVDQNQMLDKPYADAFKKILKKNQYSNIIKPQTRAIYRGMVFSEDVLRKFLKLKKSEKLRDKGEQEISLVVKPQHGDASSWTAFKSVAARFSSGTTYKDSLVGKYKIILVANPDNNANKLLDLSAIYKELKNNVIAGYEAYDRETIALGSIKVSEIIWEKAKF